MNFFSLTKHHFSAIIIVFFFTMFPGDAMLFFQLILGIGVVLMLLPTSEHKKHITEETAAQKRRRLYDERLELDVWSR